MVDRIFELVDENGDGKVIPVISCIHLIVCDSNCILKRFSLKLNCTELMQVMSAGELSLDEFIDGARRDKWVMKMLQMDVNPGEWINEQRRRSANF